MFEKFERIFIDCFEWISEKLWIILTIIFLLIFIGLQKIIELIDDLRD